MTLSVNHAFVSAIADDAAALAAGEVVPSYWNAAHTLTGKVSSAQLADTAVTPGSYTLTNLTVDQQGRITAASNGSTGLTNAYTTESGTGGTKLSAIATAGSNPAYTDTFIGVAGGTTDQQYTLSQIVIGSCVSSSSGGKIVSFDGSEFNVDSNLTYSVGTVGPTLFVNTAPAFAFPGTNEFFGGVPSAAPSGNYNICVGGAGALGALNAGNGNTSIGTAAAQGLSSGSGNNLFGLFAGEGLVSGSFNTIIYTCDVFSHVPTFPATLSNAVVIGAKFSNAQEAALVNNAIVIADGAGNYRWDYNQTVTGQWTTPAPINFAEAAAPSSPASGYGVTWFDSTNHILSSKNSSGTVSNTVVPSTAASSKFATAVSAAGVVTYTQPAYSDLSGAGAAGTVLNASTFTATPTLGASGTLGSITMGNATSGTINLQPVTGALGSVTVSIPAKTDTLVGKTTTDTFTNKTIDSAGAGNSIQVNSGALTARTGTGTTVVMQGTPTLTTPVIGAATGTSLAVTAAITSSGATNGIGYATGAGGTVTQNTSKSTGVTLNTVAGKITMNNAALAATTGVSFTLTNSAIASTDQLVFNILSGATNPGKYIITSLPSSGSATVTVYNASSGSLSEAVVMQYVLIKSVQA